MAPFEASSDDDSGDNSSGPVYNPIVEEVTIVVDDTTPYDCLGLPLYDNLHTFYDTVAIRPYWTLWRMFVKENNLSFSDDFVFSRHKIFSESFANDCFHCEFLTPDRLLEYTIADYFWILTFFGYFPNELQSLQFPLDFSPKGNFASFIIRIDPMFLFTKNLADKFWMNRVTVKRDKVAMKQLFRESLLSTRVPLEPTFKPALVTADTWPTFRESFRRVWRASYHIVVEPPDFRQESSNVAELYQESQSSGAASTDSWTRPPGINRFLANKAIRNIYKFSDGSDIFPVNYNKEFHIGYYSNHIHDGAILNPPFKAELLTTIISRLVLWAHQREAVYVVIVPYVPSADWFILCKELGVPVMRFHNPLAFQRGPEEEWVQHASFPLALLFIGTTAPIVSFRMNNDLFGYPKDNNYIGFLRQIEFPRNLFSEEASVSSRRSNVRLHLLQNLYELAEYQHSKSPGIDLTSNFDLLDSIKFNHTLQYVESGFNAQDSHQWANVLNPRLAHYADWPVFNDQTRQIFTRNSFKKWIHGFNTTPASAVNGAQCSICKKYGHIMKLCPYLIPTAQELGLKDRAELVLHEFLTNQCCYVEHNNQVFDHWSSIQAFHNKLTHWLKVEAVFWEKFKQFSQKNNISNITPLLNASDFSKGRQALGFNYALGAPLSELLLDAFGARLIMTCEPPPCEFLPDEGHEISPETAREDHREVKRGTQNILPKKYVKYILPRFTVINTDTTERTINDCRFLGPFTPINHFRLPRRSDLRQIGPNDIVLTIDGKSAYRQRKLCWADRNKIGFRSRINDLECFVAMSTPPFGMHNAGYIYQKSLEAKLKRLGGNKFWLEYIDDILVRLASDASPQEATEWIASAFLYLLTKTGEIFNDKFGVFKHRITMVGVNFYPQTDRFTPKLSSFYKLGHFLSKLLRAETVTIHDLQRISGATNWLLASKATNTIQPFNKAISTAMGAIDSSNPYEIKKAQRRTLRISPLFLDVLIDLYLEVIDQFYLISSPNLLKGPDTLYIVVDSNPQQGGGFAFYQKKHSPFMPREHFTLTDVPISNLPPSFATDYGLESILHSTRAEALGLFRFIKQNYPWLCRWARVATHITIFLDNLGLVQSLSKKSARQMLTKQLHKRIFILLSGLKLPVQFQWLRRSTPPIELADHLGRVSQPFRLTRHTLTRVRSHFDTEVYIPEVFRDVHHLSFFLPPDHWPEDTQRTPLLVIPFDCHLTHLRVLLSLVANTPRRILVGFPKLRSSLVHEYFDGANLLSFKDITNQFFIHTKIGPKKKVNFPYLFGFIPDTHPIKLFF